MSWYAEIIQKETIIVIHKLRVEDNQGIQKYPNQDNPFAICHKKNIQKSKYLPKECPSFFHMA